MTATFTVTIEIDPAVVAAEAKRHGVTVARAVDVLIGESENRVADTLRYLDGVTRVRVRRTRK